MEDFPIKLDFVPTIGEENLKKSCPEVNHKKMGRGGKTFCHSYSMLDDLTG